MEAIKKITLTEEKETLLITLYAKAMDYRSNRSILHDKKADDLIKMIQYDFSKIKDLGNNVIVIRAKQFDQWINEFIHVHPNAIVLYLGCGLDTRITRVNPPAGINWYDVDYDEVIELRKNFYADSDVYKMTASSIISSQFLKEIHRDQPTLIIAEGVLEYLTPGDVKLVFNNLTDHFLHGQIIFDVMNSFAIQSGKEKLKNTTGAVHKWAVDDVDEVDKLNPKLKRIKVMPLFKSPYVQKLSFAVRMMLEVLCLFPSYKNMMRLMQYQF